MKLTKILYPVILLPLFLILVWFFAIPDELLKEKIEEAIATIENSSINASIEEFRKGVFFTFSAGRLDLEKDERPIISITDITGRINPLSLLNRELSFSIRGRIGKGDIYGSFSLPGTGNLTVDKASLEAISYLRSLGIDSNGHLSSELTLNGDTVDISFRIPDLNIAASEKSTLPFLDSIKEVQGVLSMDKGQVSFRSVTLEGKKGYARLKGSIKNGNMDLTLEVMPSSGKLEAFEEMIIKKYLVSPGYYVMPLRGHIPI